MVSLDLRLSLGVRFALVLVWLAGMLGGLPVSRAYAATIIVPDNHATIQAAINAASPGDTVLVRAGTYTENLNLNKAITLAAVSFDSSDPTRNTTIIQARSSSAQTIVIPAGVTPMPAIRGFVIRNGLDNIRVTSDALIEYNYFVGSTDQLDFAAGGGGIVRGNVFFNSQDDAIDLDNTTRPILIENNRLMYNKDDGIEVRLQDSPIPAQPITITIRNNEIIGCDEDGIQFIDYSQTLDTRRNFTITGNVIANCRFAGIGLMGNAISIEDYSGANIVETIHVFNNTIYGNDYGISGGDNLIAYNNIIANSTTRGVWRVAGPAGASSIVAYTLFHNNGTDAEQSTLGAGNIFGQNPLFVAAPNAGPDNTWGTVDDDFSGLKVQAGSPAIDAGYDPVCPSTDLDGVSRPQGLRCDIGAFEGAGSLKPPLAALLTSPSGQITVSQPAYNWNSVLGSPQGGAATWYLVRVRRTNGTEMYRQWHQASDVCSAGTCSVQPAVSLTIGNYLWDVQTWNNAGYGSWSVSMGFTFGYKPDRTNLNGPSGTITQTAPTFSWNVPADGATTDPAAWYFLWVNGPAGNVFRQWYDGSTICSAGSCSVTPLLSLKAGNHTWWVQTWNAVGHGPWSDPLTFTIPSPGPATLISPSGITTNTTPTYTWDTVPGVTWYYLWVNGPAGNVVKQWYEAAAICNSTTCSATPGTSLAMGDHTWWVRTWNSAGYGPWSGGMSFSVVP